MTAFLLKRATRSAAPVSGSGGPSEIAINGLDMNEDLPPVFGVRPVVVQFELAARAGRVAFGSADSKTPMISSTLHT
jgi:hypothetical protein